MRATCSNFAITNAGMAAPSAQDHRFHMGIHAFSGTPISENAQVHLDLYMLIAPNPGILGHGLKPPGEHSQLLLVDVGI